MTNTKSAISAAYNPTSRIAPNQVLRKVAPGGQPPVHQARHHGHDGPCQGDRAKRVSNENIDGKRHVLLGKKISDRQIENHHDRKKRGENNHCLLPGGRGDAVFGIDREPASETGRQDIGVVADDELIHRLAAGGALFRSEPSLHARLGSWSTRYCSRDSA